MKKSCAQRIVPYLPLLLLLSIWELGARLSEKSCFMFSSPSLVLKALYNSILDGSFVVDVGVTFFEAGVGFVLSCGVGMLVGFALLSFPNVGIVMKRYITVFSAIPVFAVAPLMIIWFGVDLEMKVASSFFSTVFVIVYQTYSGGSNIDTNQRDYILRHGGNEKDIFLLLRLPSAFDWIIQSLKMSANLSVMGAFIGEFIASEKGVGHRIIKASGLYDINHVFVGIIGMLIIIFLFLCLTNYVQAKKTCILRKSMGLFNKTYVDANV